MLSKKDMVQLKELKIKEEKFHHYLDLLKAGTESAELVRPAREGDGIVKLSQDEISELDAFWAEHSPDWTTERFVPASGAATRMFKEFHDYIQEGIMSSGVSRFFEKLEDFAFYSDLPGAGNLQSREEKQALISFLLSKDGWNWSEIPKGLLPFHRLKGRTITPLEEHLRESSLITPGQDVFLHLTVSPGHKKLFEELASQIIPLLKEENRVDYSISYSFQDPSTHTPALDDQGEPFRTDEGRLLFRPGGHGSLLGNLNNLDRDIIFLKNIDNVSTGEYGEISALWFRLFGALLIKARKELNKAEEQLRLYPDESNHNTACQVLKRWGGADFCGGEDTRQLLKRLNRPLRICGMVRNDGDTGGGPFWVIDGRGDCSLQIVESAQIDKEKPGISEKIQQITHFNPVFIACSLKDCQGEKLNLEEYVDQNAIFTAEKSLQGRKLKALEHPGLWNGSMAYWNTSFVEIPLECFNPVKSLPDLLKKAHTFSEKV